MPAVAQSTPRVVLVTRPTELELLLAKHATRGQARFFLSTRGGSIDEVEQRHHAFAADRAGVLASLPPDWQRTEIDRADLDRFLFQPTDIVIVLGQDGLVANVAKYLAGQPVIGLDPEPGRNAGVLVRHAPAATADLLADLLADRAELEERTMVEARLVGGGRLLALNEIFVGHRSHQSARYRLEADGTTERQSSSGLIISTGSGSTGWASSIRRERRCGFDAPAPGDTDLAWYVREAWPSAATGTSLTGGLLADGHSLRVVSEMDRGVAFGDGIETDHLALPWGQPVEVARAPEVLRLVR